MITSLDKTMRYQMGSMGQESTGEICVGQENLAI